MGSLTDRAVYFGPKAQWRQLRDRGCITDPVCFQEVPLTVERDFRFAKQGTEQQSYFCIAMSTGICRPSLISDKNSNNKSSCTTEIFQAISEIGLAKLCPQFQVSVPP